MPEQELNHLSDTATSEPETPALLLAKLAYGLAKAQAALVLMEAELLKLQSSKPNFIKPKQDKVQ